MDHIVVVWKVVLIPIVSIIEGLTCQPCVCSLVICDGISL